MDGGGLIAGFGASESGTRAGGTQGMARLKILSGANVGESIELSAPQVLLGRHSSCDVVITAGKVSRQHARIVREGNEFLLEDLHSRNGTFVNGQRVENRVRLNNGDRIELADSVLTFQSNNGSSAVVEEQERPDSREITKVPAPAEPSPPHIVQSLDATDVERLGINAAAKLRVMLELSRRIGASLNLDEVVNGVLEGAFQIFPQAERGYILLAGGPKGRLELKALKLRRDEQGFAVTIRPISRTITQAVMSEQKAILSSDAQSDQRFVQSESVLDFEIRSMMCAPLIGPSRQAVGLIYIDTSEVDREFTETDLDILLSVSALAAQSIEYARLHEKLLEERKAADEAVRASEARFRAVWDNSADAMRLTDKTGVVIAVNRAYCEITGLPAQELEGRLFTEAYADDDGLEALREYRARFQSASMPVREERTQRFRSGRSVELQITSSLIEVEPHSFVQLSIFHDLTERKQAETALRASEERFGAVLDESTIGIAVADGRGYIVQINPAFERIVGAAEAELLGRDLIEVLWPGEGSSRSAPPASLFESGGSEYRAQRRFQRRNGDDVWVNLTLSVIREPDGRLLHLIALLEDVSDRKRLEREVADQSVAEQRRIGQELHDDLGQVLTGLNYMSQTLAKRLKGAGVPEAEAAEQVAEGIQGALTQVRTIARGLVPVEIDQKEGLRTALEDLATRTTKIYGIECRLECPPEISLREGASAVHLYHIAQEAVTNAIKHGHARRIEIQLRTSPRETVLAVIDNGAGMQASGEAGIGLRIMRYRAGVIGATLDIRSKPGEGTIVRCTLEH